MLYFSSLSWMKMISMSIIVFSVFLAFSSKNIFIIWICMELNMMFFIFLNNFQNKFSTESMIIYFMIQTLGSLIFLFSIFISQYVEFLLASNLVVLSMLMKLGLFPFSAWYVQTLEGLDWPLIAILSTTQKMIPLMLISWFTNTSSDFWIIMSILMTISLIYNQISIRKILGYSSILNICWALCSMQCFSNIWLIYMFMYFFIVFSVLKSLFKTNVKTISDFYYLKKYNFMAITLGLLSFAGLPPLLGFFSKLMVLKMSDLSPLLLYLLLFSSFFMCFIYIRLVFPLLFSTSTKKMNKESNFLIILLNSAPLFLLFLFYLTI